MGEANDNATTHHDMQCPKCKNENTQAIDLLIKANTQNISTTTSTAGVGVSLSGDVSIGGASSSTKGQSVSELAKELSTKFNPKKFSIGETFGVILLLISLLPTYLIHTLLNIRIQVLWWWTIPITFLGLCIFLYKTSSWFNNWLEEIKVNKEKNKLGLELWKRWTTQGYFCHRCGHTFIPGSDEAFKAIE